MGIPTNTSAILRADERSSLVAALTYVTGGAWGLAVGKNHPWLSMIAIAVYLVIAILGSVWVKRGER